MLLKKQRRKVAYELAKAGMSSFLLSKLLKDDCTSRYERIVRKVPEKPRGIPISKVNVEERRKFTNLLSFLPPYLASRWTGVLPRLRSYRQL